MKLIMKSFILNMFLSLELKMVPRYNKSTHIVVYMFSQWLTVLASSVDSAQYFSYRPVSQKALLLAV